MEPHELMPDIRRAIDEEMWEQLGSRLEVVHAPWSITTAPNAGKPWTFELKFTVRRKYPEPQPGSTPTADDPQAPVSQG